MRGGAARLLLLLPAAVRSQWKPLATHDGSTPTAREEGSYFLHGGKLCLFGGRGLLPIDCFDATAKKWHRSTTKTDDIHHVQPVVWRDEVWVVAGWFGKWPGPWCCESPTTCVDCGEKQLTHALVYTPATDTMRIGCQIPPEFARGSAGVVAWGEHIYVANGAVDGHQKAYGGKPYLGFSRFDPSSCAWAALPHVPSYPRDHYLAALVGSRMVLAAGRDSTASNDPALCCSSTTAATEWIDLALLDGDGAVGWQEGEQIPTPRAGYALAVWGGQLIVAGGESDITSPAPECAEFSSISGGAASHDDVESYDVESDTWTTMPRLTTGRQSAAAAVLIDKLGGTRHGKPSLVVAGGVGCAGSAPLLATTEAYPMRFPSPPPAKALEPPPPPPPIDEAVSAAGSAAVGGKATEAAAAPPADAAADAAADALEGGGASGGGASGGGEDAAEGPAGPDDGSVGGDAGSAPSASPSPSNPPIYGDSLAVARAVAMGQAAGETIEEEVEAEALLPATHHWGIVLSSPPAPPRKGKTIWFGGVPTNIALLAFFVVCAAIALPCGVKVGITFQELKEEEESRTASHPHHIIPPRDGAPLRKKKKKRKGTRAAAGLAAGEEEEETDDGSSVAGGSSAC